MSAIEKPEHPAAQQAIREISEFVIHLTPFDQREALRLVEARGETMRRVVRSLMPALNLSTALDAGCGVGFFSRMLQECALQVRGFDGRSQNVAEARARFPEIAFEQRNVEDPGIRDLGVFDLVLCFGLLYHLENPLLAIRNLRAMTGKCLLLESMCAPGEGTGALLREEPREDDQSLTDVAFYPSESTLIKMLYRASFQVVYRIVSLPDHNDFRDTQTHRQRRTMLLASNVPVDVAGFRLCPEPLETQDPWCKGAPLPTGAVQRLRRFLARPRREKYFALGQRLRRAFPSLGVPFRLSFGCWWLAENSVVDQELTHHNYEKSELKFVQRLLRPGMTVLDLGAHHGLYSLLAAKCVGRTGKVLAFEPSPRERRRLLRNLKINGHANVEVQDCALGADSGSAMLFLVGEGQDGCNSLRPPAVRESTSTLCVPLRRVDEELARLGVSHVDFVKLDVEGAELGVLQGAAALLSTPSRPAILAEVQDVRTRPWGYAAREIVQFLVRKEYRWFALDAEGTLMPVSTQQEHYDANLVALPKERIREFILLLDEGAFPHRRAMVPATLSWTAVFRKKSALGRCASRGYESWLPRSAEPAASADSSPDA
jgi:FkbM family methyltransferase